MIQQQGRRKHEYSCFLPPRWNTLRFTQATVKATITHNNFRHCRVSFFSFVRQPYSKQLYITDQMQCDMCPEKRNVVVTECFSQLVLRDEPNKTPQLMCGQEPWTFQKIRKVFGSSNFAPTIVKIKFTLSSERFPKSSRLQILHQLTAYEHLQRAATNQTRLDTKKISSLTPQKPFSTCYEKPLSNLRVTISIFCTPSLNSSLLLWLNREVCLCPSKADENWQSLVSSRQFLPGLLTI